MPKEKRADAEVHRRILKKRKGEDPKTVLEQTFRVGTETFTGNELAEVGRSRSIKFGIGYGEFSISGSATVRLHCNQDDATILHASETARRIADHVMREDQAAMRKVIRKVAKELEAEENQS